METFITFTYRKCNREALDKRLFPCSLFYEIQVLDCLLDVMGNVLYPDDVELALGLLSFELIKLVRNLWIINVQ